MDFGPHPRIDELIGKARLGSLEALWRLLAVSRGYLLMIASRRIAPGLLARAHPSDLVGEVIIEAQRDFGAFKGETPAEWWRWLRRLLLHNLANFQRDQQRKKRNVALEIPLNEVSANVSARLVSSTTPSSEVIASEERVAVEVALARLAGNHREVVLLRNRDGLTFEQIGERLHCSADAARRLWARALLSLQRELEGMP